MPQRIIVHIDPNGNSEVKEVSGFGKNCQEMTSRMEGLMGVADEKSRTTTAEINDEITPLLDLDRQ